LEREANANKEANIFITEELTKRLTTLLLESLKEYLVRGEYPSFFRTVFKLYKSSKQKQDILHTAKSKIETVIQKDLFATLSHLVSSKSFSGELHKKIAVLLFTVFFKLDLKSEMSADEIHSFIGLADTLDIKLSPEQAYMLYKQYKDKEYQFNSSMKEVASSKYFYRYFSEEMKKQELNSTSVQSLIFCVFSADDVDLRGENIEDIICPLLRHKGWEEYERKISTVYHHTLDLVEDAMRSICGSIIHSSTNINDRKRGPLAAEVIDILWENTHIFRPLFIIQTTDLMMRNMLDYPRPEYSEILHKAYKLMVKATMLHRLEE
jgi:hypothetical protein